jgi:hypothetical protein
MSTPLGTLVFHVTTNVKIADSGPGPWWEHAGPAPLDELTLRQLTELHGAVLNELALRLSPDERAQLVELVELVSAVTRARQRPPD